MSSALGDEVIDKGLTTAITGESGLRSIHVPSRDVGLHSGSNMLSSVLIKDGGSHGKEVSFDHDDSHPPVTTEAALGHTSYSEEKDSSKISAYARLDFDNYTFFVQTLQVILGRKSNDELINGSQHSVDVHLSSKKAISRRHAKIFYNFGTQRFELSILGRNGAFVDDLFIEKGMTIPLVDGTKIQIGDITFKFVLPSVEADEVKDLAHGSKPFNPSDAISLRSSLYSNSTSPSKPNKSIPETERRKSIRRGSRNIPRRLSEARRKSLASATNEEISAILNELGVKTLDDIEDIDEQNPEYVDAQIRAILGDGSINGESAIADDDDDDDILDSKDMIDNEFEGIFNEAEEDEIDQLVKQHNLEQGVDLDESALDRDDMGMGVIDEEIANFAPLIAHNQEKEKPKNFYAAGQYNINRSGPLMGKPATPRMGKPASIQPPSSRLYGRTVLATGIAKNQVIDTRLQSMGTSIGGLPAHLISHGPNDYSLKVAQGNIGSYNQQLAGNQFGGYNKPYIPTRPPVPELLVPIHTIEQKPAPQPEIIIDKITVTTDYAHPPIYIPKIIGKPGMIPKIPKRRIEPLSSKKSVKNIYSMNEIPEHYRTKPTLSFPVMIINVLKFKNDSSGLTFNDINEGIKEIYPYYKYCPDGWQSFVIHNIRLNKLFKRVESNDEQEEYEQRWLIDEAFVQEKEKVRKKQQEIAAQRAKEAAIRAEELKQKQRLEMQQSISQNIVGRDFNSPYGLPLGQHAHLLNQSQLLAQLHQKNSSLYQTTSLNGQKPKTIAEIASEIRRDGQNSKTPMYFKPLSSSDKPAGSNGESPSTIKAQLAANRSQYSQSPVGGSSESSPARTQSPSMNQDTKKSLTYLQKELFTLYKARKLSYNTATTTEIITKALATTIAQVNAIGSKAGVGDNALSFLVERAPQQVSKILDIALTKSIKEKQGIASSRPNSRGTTPGPSQISSPKRPSNGLANSDAPSSSIVSEANKIGIERLEQKKKEHEQPIVIDDIPGENEKERVENNSSLGKPPLFKATKSESPLSRPLPGPARPQSLGKPSGLTKPPFVSNKPPTRPGYGAKPERKDDEDSNKRSHDSDQESSLKMPKIQ